MTPFQAGLALTALVLAGVAFERSLFEIRRARGSSGFSWTRWYHLTVMWGLALFVLPFALGVLFPSRALELSGGLDQALGMEHMEDAGAGPLVQPQRDSLFVVALGAAAVIAGFGAAASIGRRQRRPWFMAAMSAGALAAIAISFILAGGVASHLSGANAARHTIAQYASAPSVGSTTADGGEAPAVPDGPVKVTGTAAGSTLTRNGNFFDGSLEGEPAGPFGGFKTGPYLIPAHASGGIHVVMPHVRLGPAGREVYIDSGEEITVYGYAENGAISPRPGYPVVVAPASAERVLEELGVGLFGAEARRRRCLLTIQLVLGALAAWHAATLGAALCERLLANRVATVRPITGEPADA